MTKSHTQSTAYRMVSLALLALIGVLAHPAEAQSFGGDSQVQPRVIAATQSIQPGQTTTIAVHFDIQDKWHLYWTNPEGAGFAPEVEWTLPEGYTISEPIWPAPQTFEFVGNIQYGYENQLTLLFELTAPDNAQGSVKLDAGLTWLVCDQSNCVPSPGYPNPVSHSLELPVSGDPPAPSDDAETIERARQTVPRDAPDWSFEAQRTDKGFELVMQAPDPAAAQQLDGLYFFSGKQFVVDPATSQELAIDGETARLTLRERQTDDMGDPIQRDQPVTALRGVLSAEQGFGSVGPVAIRIDTQIDGVNNSATSPGAAQTQTQTPNQPQDAGPESAGQEPIGFVLALGMAFVGGLILNLMPCVFPVLSIKILGFVQVAGEKPAIVRRHGYAFGIGVLLSFWVLVGVLLILRNLAEAAGGGVSWGFQLQNPVFVLGMLLLVFVIGLNLIGAFEIGLGLSAAAGKASQSVQKDGYGKSLFTGVLATLIATPCTGPFMAPAIGAALSMPNLQAFLVFTSLGVGMAVPYVLLSCFPGLMRYLPKPGPWMESFKQAMAFPMFATAGWLAWVYAGLTSEGMVARLLIGLTIVAMGAWVYGRWSTPMRTAQTRWIARTVALLAVVGGVALIQTGALAIQQQRDAVAAARASGGYVYEWVDYSPETVQSLRESGRPVLIDFTARWCAICQANKKSSLRTSAAKALYEKHDVALVEADNTVSNPEIDQVLKEYDRAGVPLYLVFPAGDPDAQPQVLPELLTPQIVREAIQQAAGNTAGPEPATASR